MLTTVCPLEARRACTRVRAHLHLESYLENQRLDGILLLLLRCPERHFDRNQLPDGSFGLSPLNAASAIELNIRMAYILRQSFLSLQYHHV